MIAGLKPYAEMKDSGLPWLGLIPKTWQVQRAKTVLRRIDVRSSAGTEELLTVSSKLGVVPRRTANVTMFQAESYAGHKLCWPGDLVINSLWAWGRGLGVAQHHGIVSTAYGVYRARDSAGIDPRYLHELVRSSPFHWELQVRSKGVWISRLQLTDESFLNAPLPLPPVDEQAAIVRFLDHADRRIRRAIAAKQKLIRLLEEQKQAIIHRAVTRGLDPDVRLKPSGVEWLGDVPEHWGVRQVRRVVSLVTSGSRGWASYYSESGDIFLQSGNLGRSMALNLERIQYVTPPRGAEGERTKVRRDDVLVCVTGALTGNVALVEQDFAEPAYINQHVALLRPRPELIFPRFLALVLHSELGKAQFKTSEYGGTKQGLGLEDVKSAFVLLPSVAEQMLICTAVDEKVGALTTANDRAEREIRLLREFRTRLIADVVTGKLDVREAAARLPESPAPELTDDEALDAEDDDEASPDEAVAEDEAA